VLAPEYGEQILKAVADRFDNNTAIAQRNQHLKIEFMKLGLDKTSEILEAIEIISANI